MFDVMAHDRICVAVPMTAERAGRTGLAITGKCNACPVWLISLGEYFAPHALLCTATHYNGRVCCAAFVRIADVLDPSAWDIAEQLYPPSPAVDALFLDLTRRN